MRAGKLTPLVGNYGLCRRSCDGAGNFPGARQVGRHVPVEQRRLTADHGDAAAGLHSARPAVDPMA